MRQFIIVEVSYPQFVAFRITEKRSLIFFEFCEMDVLEPIAVIEGEVLEEAAQEVGVVIGLRLLLQILRPESVLFTVAAVLYLFEKNVELFVHDPLIISSDFA